jgi:hypothetical protein
VIDFSMDEMLELARQAELQKRVEAAGVKAPEPFPDFCVVETLRAVRDDQGFEVPEGTQGTVLDPLGNGAFYIVEFDDPAHQNRDRLGLATLPPDVLRVVWLPGDPVALPEDLRGKLGETAEEKLTPNSD